MKNVQRSVYVLATLSFLQMLPAIAIGPAVRPLFAHLHNEAEGPMHAFMSVNMLAAVIAAPLVGRLLDRHQHRRSVLFVMLVCDALLLVTCAQPIPVHWVLLARFFEGAAHVSATTILLIEAGARAREQDDPRIMGIVGSGLVAAIAAGHAVGAWLVAWSAELPFLVGAAIALGLSCWAPREIRTSTPSRVRTSLSSLRPVLMDLGAPLGAAWVSRFAVGCLVVTFALFGHKIHALSDRAIGGLFASMTGSFALATYIASTLCSRFTPSLVLTAGCLLFGGGLGALGFVDTRTLWCVMPLLGVASAAIFSSTLNYATSTRASTSGRAVALFNAAGCAGMLMGPIAAGVLSALLTSHADPSTRYRAVFLLAAGAVFAYLALSSARLLHMIRSEATAARQRERAPQAARA